MTKSRCPHCGITLGNYLYADECPRCHEELKHNTKALTIARHDLPGEQGWLLQIFGRLMRVVES